MVASKFGNLHLQRHPESSYMIQDHTLWLTEGVIILVGWIELVNRKCLLEIGDTLLLLLYLHRRAWFCMFVVEVSTMTAEKDRDAVLWHILDCS
jgi:hypothetical protein